MRWQITRAWHRFGVFGGLTGKPTMPCQGMPHPMLEQYMP